MTSVIEAHEVLDKAGWPQGHLTDRIKRLTRALIDFREIADDPSRNGLFLSLEKTSTALRRERAEKQELLERAQRAEAETREAVTRAANIEETLFAAVDDYLYDSFHRGHPDKGYPKNHCNPERLQALREAFLAVSSMPPNSLLERLAELETHAADLREELKQSMSREATLVKVLDAIETQVLLVAELRGALQAALLPLERAADALVPPGRRVEEAWDLIEEAMVTIREEIG